MSPVKYSSCWLQQITWLQISYRRGWKTRKTEEDRNMRLDIRKTLRNKIRVFFSWEERQGQIMRDKGREGGEINACDSYSQGRLSFCLTARHEWVDFNSIDCCFGHQQTHVHTAPHARAQTLQSVWNTEQTRLQVSLGKNKKIPSVLPVSSLPYLCHVSNISVFSVFFVSWLLKWIFTL